MRNELIQAVKTRIEDNIGSSGVTYGTIMRANPKSPVDLSLPFPVIALSLGDPIESMYIGAGARTTFPVIVRFIHHCNWRDADATQERIYSFVEFMESTFNMATTLSITHNEQEYTVKIKPQMETYFDTPFYSEQIEMSVDFRIHAMIVRSRK
jgi:hypothetical protein